MKPRQSRGGFASVAILLLGAALLLLLLGFARHAASFRRELRHIEETHRQRLASPTPVATNAPPSLPSPRP